MEVIFNFILIKAKNLHRKAPLIKHVTFVYLVIY